MVVLDRSPVNGRHTEQTRTQQPIFDGPDCRWMTLTSGPDLFPFKTRADRADQERPRRVSGVDHSLFFPAGWLIS